MWNERTKSRVWVIVALLLALGGVIYLLRGVLAPVLFALLLAYVLDPFVTMLTKRRVPRPLAVGLVAGTLALIVIGGMLIFIPLVYDEISTFARELPERLNDAQARFEPTLVEWTGMGFPALFERATDKLKTALEQNGASLSGVFASAYSGTWAVIGILTTLVLVPIFATFFLADFPRLVRAPLMFVPPRHHAQVTAVAHEIDDVLSGFVHAQLAVCLILGLLYGTGYALVGVPLGFLVGLMAGALAFIPYVGAGLGLFLALLFGLLEWQGWALPLATLGVYAFIQALDAVAITPRIIGNRVGLSPVVVIIALMVGNTLFGFTGVLLALPATAVLNILARHAIHRYTATDFYREPPSPGAGNAP